jgi:hypothetical protein
MLSRKNVNLLTIILISISFICLGGTFYDLHSSQGMHMKQPLFWPLAIGFSSAGGGLLLGLLLKIALPEELMLEMRSIKKFKI